jgi:hypothetical protein
MPNLFRHPIGQMAALLSMARFGCGVLKQVQHDLNFYYVILRYEASPSPCIAAMLVEEDASYLRMTGFLNYVMGNLFQDPIRKVGDLLSMWLSE